MSPPALHRLALCAALAASACGTEAPDTPVILITIDTQRVDRLSCFGYEKDTSPEIARFAASCARFENHHVQAPLTLPSHSSIMTGLMPYNHGVPSNGGFELSQDATTLAERLSDVGYDTGAVVSAGVLHAQFGLDQGFDTYDWGLDGDTTLSHTDAEHATTRALAWLGRERDAPPFLWLHYFDPHGPLEAPARFDDPDPYDAEVRYTDEQLGVLMRALQAEPWFDEALVVLTSDHGQHLGEHGYNGHTLSVYEETLHAPLLIRFPRSEHAGRTVSALTRSTDLLPTILRAVGLEPHAELDGVPLQDAVLGEGPPLELESYGETRFAGQRALHKRSLIRGRWKFISKYNLDPDTDVIERLGGDLLKERLAKYSYTRDLMTLERSTRELYDLQLDPEESVNLYASQPDIAAEMEAALAAHTVRWEVAVPTVRHSPDEDTERHLKQLGY